MNNFSYLITETFSTVSRKFCLKEKLLTEDFFFVFFFVKLFSLPYRFVQQLSINDVGNIEKSALRTVAHVIYERPLIPLRIHK